MPAEQQEIWQAGSKQFNLGCSGCLDSSHLGNWAGIWQRFEKEKSYLISNALKTIKSNMLQVHNSHDVIVNDTYQR